MFDKEIRREQVQGIRNSDGVGALFADLGYQTAARVVQSPDALGIMADSTVAQIKKIERVADQEGLLQIYLFELISLTQALTQTIVRAFRNRVGQYLLVLTNGYDRLDFVLIERLLPPTRTEGLVPRQVTLRPRIVSIERQNPTRVHMRLLRRLTYTESDPGYQFEKLRSAFDMAEWSEEFFNNRGLFSDYYLKERLPESEAWKDDPKPAYKHLRELLTKASERWVGQSKAAIVKELVQPALHVLEFSTATSQEAAHNGLRPDLLLSPNSSDKTPVALCLIYPWARWLDGKDDQRDAETSEDNPGARVVSLLEEGRALWAILTNGKVWRLYSSKTHSRATNYYEIDLEETLALSGFQGEDAGDAFRYFWLLFRGNAFAGSPSFLEDILSGSEAYAKKLGDRLKGRIFEEIFPVFAEGFIEDIRRKNGGHADLPQPELDQVFQGTLTFLYRLLFILYAEARDLLPVREYHGYGQKSLKAVKEEIAAKGCDLLDHRDEKLSKGYATTETTLYRRILHLCAVIDKGDKSLNLPMYNGGLFMTDPADEEDSPESANARFLRDHVIPDRWLARGLDRLARDQDDKSFKLVFIDYKSLGVRHLGSIYEGLLEFKLRIAPEKMAIVQGKKTEEIVPYKEAVKEEGKILKTGRGKDAAKRIKKTGELYLENDRRERKATGSYYTPDYIVQYIVEHAVGPVLEEKCSALAPKLRDAQKALKQERDKATALRRMGGKHDDPEHEAYLKHRQVVDDLFDVKVLDPAMGSGHFLVETVDFITDKMLHFLNGFTWNPVLAHLKETRETILAEIERQGITINTARLSDVNLLKRHVLKRCIYGVDLNPMAVELAKVSLWLDCFTLGAPLSFLDHHLKCGNSLIGATVDQVDKALETQEMPSLFHTNEFARELVAVDFMRRIGELSDVTPEQVRESRQEFKKAVSALIPAKTVMDIYVSRWFGNEPKHKTEGTGKTLRKKKTLHDYALEFLRTKICNQWLIQDPTKMDSLDGLDRQIAETALKAVRDKRFFHWEIEFPELFFAPRKGTTMVIERKPDAGFDAVVGNPPYDVLASEELGYDVSQDLVFYESAPVYEAAVRGTRNLYKLFICRGVAAMNSTASFSFIVPMSLLGDDQAAGVRHMLLEHISLKTIEAFPQKDAANDRVFPEAKLSTAIFLASAKHTYNHFMVRTHSGRLIEEAAQVLRVLPGEIAIFDPHNGAIPSCTQEDWNIAMSIWRHHIQRMETIGTLSEGEVHALTHRSCIAPDNDGPIILRGANICLYAVREASQGETLRLNVEKFLSGKREDSRAYAHRYRRVVLQRSAPQNNFRRLIAAIVNPDGFCFDTVKYVLEHLCKIDIDLLVALLNSKILDWYFRLGSTNSKVNEYQFNALPVPTISGDAGNLEWKSLFKQEKWSELTKCLCSACKEAGIMPTPVGESLAEMSRCIQEIESKRVLRSRSARSHLAPEAQLIQDVIDPVLFRCYGLSDEEGDYINRRLGEML